MTNAEVGTMWPCVLCSATKRRPSVAQVYSGGRHRVCRKHLATMLNVNSDQVRVEEHYPHTENEARAERAEAVRRAEREAASRWPLAWQLGFQNGGYSLQPQNINCRPLIWTPDSPAYGVPLASFSHPREQSPAYLAGYVAGREAERQQQKEEVAA